MFWEKGLRKNVRKEKYGVREPLSSEPAQASKGKERAERERGGRKLSWEGWARRVPLEER